MDGSTSGSIATQWNVRWWPNVWVLDAKGVIRFRGVRGKQVDEAVETLLKEMKREY